jgi:hypothetical protein
MSDTPETDAAQFGTGRVSVDFARRLERERDEAREALEFRRELYKVQEERLESAMRERDEAREELKHITEYGTEEINASVELRQKLAAALIERDEAREEIQKLQEWIDLTDSGLRLRCGELTAQEIRTVRSVLKSIITNE